MTCRKTVGGAGPTNLRGRSSAAVHLLFRVIFCVLLLYFSTGIYSQAGWTEDSLILTLDCLKDASALSTLVTSPPIARLGKRGPITQTQFTSEMAFHSVLR